MINNKNVICYRMAECSLSWSSERWKEESLLAMYRAYTWIGSSNWIQQEASWSPWNVILEDILSIMSQNLVLGYDKPLLTDDTVK